MDIGTIIGFAAAALLLLPVLVGGVFVILIVANRADPDPTGRRPVVVSFITLFVTLFASVVFVSRLTSLIGSHPTASLSSDASSTDFFGTGTATIAHGPQHPFGDSVARGVVFGLLLAIVAGFVHLLHVRAGQRATHDVAANQPAGRVRASYLAAVSFVCVVVAVISAVAAAYQVFRIIAPGVFNSSGSGSSTAALRTMLPLLYLTLATLELLRRHVQQLPPESRPSFGGHDYSPPGTAAEPAEAVPVVEMEILDSGPKPRKRAPRPPKT
jgi:hypothetical protein